MLMSPQLAGATTLSVNEIGKWSYSTAPDELGLYISKTTHQGSGNAAFEYACSNKIKKDRKFSFYLKTTEESLKRVSVGPGNLEFIIDDNKPQNLNVLTEVSSEEKDWNMRMTVIKGGRVSPKKFLRQIMKKGEMLKIRIGKDAYLVFSLDGAKDAINHSISSCDKSLKANKGESDSYY